jgi:acetyltransferase-like isoleucine patch superfamily enzyme
MRGVYSRQAFYHATLAGCGQDSYFGWQSVFSMTVARIGNNVYIGRRCNIGFADIGDNVMLADGVQILSGGKEHGRGDGETAHQDHAQEFRRTRIGAGAWLGTNSVILADVGIGSIIGAGAVVTQPIPDHVVAAGVPAKVIRHLRDSKSMT